jgi:peptidoglycan/LPS O-acetylase OafA/YrhL
MSSDAPAIHATRPQPDLPGRIQSIDGLRAVAMLLVFTFHVWEFSGRPALSISLFGLPINIAAFIAENTRVALFIVLSGFCLFLPFCKRPELMERFSAPQYYWHRFRRIAPPYYAALLYPLALTFLLVVTFKLLGLAAHWQTIPTGWQYLTHLFFIHTLSLGTWNSVNGSLWTLGLEAQFYLVFPVLVWGFRRWGARLIGALVLGSVLYRIAAAWMTSGQTWEVRFLSEVFFAGLLMQFALGMGAAWFVFRWRERREHLGAWTGSLLVLAAIGLYQLALVPLPDAIQFLPWRSTLLGVAFAVAIVAFSISITPFRWVVENRLMSRLGLISYSLFLIHQPTAWYVSEFLSKFLHTSGQLHFFLAWTIGFAATLLVGGLLYWFVERPFIGSPKRTSAKERSPTFPPAALAPARLASGL